MTKPATPVWHYRCGHPVDSEHIRVMAETLKTVLQLFGYDPQDPANLQDLELVEDRLASGLILPRLSRRKFIAGAGAFTAMGAVGGLKAFSFPARRRYPGLVTGLDRDLVATNWNGMVFMHPSHLHAGSPQCKEKPEAKRKAQ